MHYSAWFYVALGIERRVSCTLGKRSTHWSTSSNPQLCFNISLNAPKLYICVAWQFQTWILNCLFSTCHSKPSYITNMWTWRCPHPQFKNDLASASHWRHPWPLSDFSAFVIRLLLFQCAVGPGGGVGLSGNCSVICVWYVCSVCPVLWTNALSTLICPSHSFSLRSGHFCE